MALGTRAPSRFNFLYCHSVFGKNIAKQECLTVGCVPSAAVAVEGGGYLSRGMYAWGVSAWGVCPDNPPCEHRCKNITFPQLLLKYWTRHCTLIYVTDLIHKAVQGSVSDPRYPRGAGVPTLYRSQPFMFPNFPTPHD